MTENGLTKRAQAGAENLAKFNRQVAEGKRLPGALIHGGFCRNVAKRYTDKRTTQGRQLEVVRASLVEHYGGAENLTPPQGLLIDRILEKLIVLWQIGKFIDTQDSILSKDGELLSCLGRNYLSYAAEVRRDLQALSDMVGKRVTKIPTVEDIIQGEKR